MRKHIKKEGKVGFEFNECPLIAKCIRYKETILLIWNDIFLYDKIEKIIKKQRANY